jgi:hypothetical protein
MSKTQKTPIPLPGLKSKSKATKAPVTSSKPPLSQEYIDSSNDESDANVAPPPRKEKAKAQKQTKQNALTTIGVHRPKPNGVVKKTQVPVPNQTPAPKVVNEELESSSSDSAESDHENVEGQEYPSRQNAGEKPAEEESDSDSDTSTDDSSSESEEETTITSAPTAAKEYDDPPKYYSQHTNMP